MPKATPSRPVALSSSADGNGFAGAGDSKTSRLMAVMFADVSGSTMFYDTLGDTQAKRMVDECIALMRNIVGRYGGRVVKTIGDEVMCVLPDADSACIAATDMQHKISALPAVSNIQRSIRVGFHFGPVIEENNDVFGDTVNLAARMSKLAKSMQIITTRTTVDRLSSPLRGPTRRIAALSVKGKGDDIEVWEVIWQASDEQTLMTLSIMPTFKLAKLRLQYAGQTYFLEEINTGIVLGRDVTSDIVVIDRMASRQHARIECRRDKFFLIDQSTNGTFVAVTGEPEIILRREEVMLRGSGSIGFGHSIDRAGDEVVEFSILR
jgi:adenylate cyclase